MGKPQVQQALDVALAWAVLDSHLDVADFRHQHAVQLAELASILHEITYRDDYEGMQFLIDRGIDMTITDYRCQAMAQWLDEAERRRAPDR